MFLLAIGSHMKSQPALWQLLITIAAISGCVPSGSQGLIAEQYFSDPEAIALCHAIEAGDVELIDDMVEAGADVNVRGENNMTPLMWAFVNGRILVCKGLLFHGADPNVALNGDIDSRMIRTQAQQIRSGQSVIYLSAIARELAIAHESAIAREGYGELFEWVMESGGDPDASLACVETVLHAVIRGHCPHQRKARWVQLLIDRQVSLDVLDRSGNTPAICAMGWGGQHQIALMLLRAGANPLVYRENDNQRPVHCVVRALDSPVQIGGTELKEIVRILQEHGESIDATRLEMAAYGEWAKASKSARIGERREREVAVRKEREGAVKKRGPPVTTDRRIE